MTDTMAPPVARPATSPSRTDRTARPERSRAPHRAPGAPPASRTPATRTPAARTPAARTPAARTPARGTTPSPAAERSGRAGGTAPFVLLIMVLLASGLVATLWLSTAAAADSYRLENARNGARDLSEQAESLRRDVEAKQSAPSVAAGAARIGMVPGGTPAVLLVRPDGSTQLVGTPTAAPAAPPAPAGPTAPTSAPASARATPSSTGTPAATTTAAGTPTAATPAAATPLTGDPEGPR